MAEHTPGPWEASLFHIEANGETIAIAEPENIEEARANARMMAASLDLLAVVKRIRDIGVILEDDTLDMMDRAITKAEGGNENKEIYRLVEFVCNITQCGVKATLKVPVGLFLDRRLIWECPNHD